MLRSIRKTIALCAMLSATILLGGCDDNDNPPVQQTIQGSVIGSHYEGAWVCVDSDSNALCDNEKIITVSDANGRWELDDPQNNALNVVAEIYADNIKHSNYPPPPSSTLVENPMIFVAPLKGQVDGKLIVSPISTMVYRSMQENGTSFEVAKESVANEIGVPSNVLLTNYDVETPSVDQAILQRRSDVEAEQLAQIFHYHDNWINFIYLNNDTSITIIKEANYLVKDYCITSGQDPDHHINIGTRIISTPYENYFTLDFVLGRKGSTDVADWWKNRVSSDENIYNNEPDELNFAFKGDLTIMFENNQYVFSDFYLAQGHKLTWNNWWAGGTGCSCTGDDTITCNSIDEDGNTVRFTIDNDIVTGYFEIRKVE